MFGSSLGWVITFIQKLHKPLFLSRTYAFISFLHHVHRGIFSIKTPRQGLHIYIGDELIWDEQKAHLVLKGKYFKKESLLDFKRLSMVELNKKTRMMIDVDGNRNFTFKLEIEQLPAELISKLKENVGEKITHVSFIYGKNTFSFEWVRDQKTLVLDVGDVTEEVIKNE